MTESNDRASKNNQAEQDVELGLLLHKAAREIKRFFQLIGKGFAAVGMGILESVFFLRKNILWLILGATVGWLYGLYLHSREGSKYYSTMTLRANFNSSRALYKGVGFFNTLTDQRKFSDLSRLLGISLEEARSLISFDASPVESENIDAELYKEKFLHYERNDRLRLDTVWIRTLKYSEFKDGLTKYDYPLQEITVVSTDPLLFPKIQQGFIEQISRSPLLRGQRETQLKFNREEDSILALSIKGLDSLRYAYNMRLMQGGKTTEGGGNTLAFIDKPVKITAPELELYDKLLEVKDELRDSRNKASLSKDIFQIYSPINPIGQPISIIKQSMTRYAILGLLVVLIILVSVKFYLYLGYLEESIKNNESETPPPDTE